jgi:two-component system alkaline phosphatase synthesis response regulator PhoP
VQKVNETEPKPCLFVARPRAVVDVRSHVMPDCFSVLVVDGDLPTLHLIENVLTAEGCLASCVSTGQGAIDAFRQDPYPLVLLDPTLQDMDGLAVCSSIRTLPQGESAVMVLISACQDLAAKVAGFGAGADDFLGKPLEMYELALRVKAIRRQLSGHHRQEHADLALGPFRLLLQTRSLLTPSGPVNLTPMEFRLMAYFMQRPDTLIAAETLLCDVWQFHPGTGSAELVRFHINSLRKKLEPNPREPVYLINSQGHGYALRPSADRQQRLG